MDKDDKLKCYTLKAPSDGHRYVTCDDKGKKVEKPKPKKLKLRIKTPKEAATDAMTAIKEVKNISGNPKLKKQFIEKVRAELKPVIDRELPDDVLQNIKEFARPRNDVLVYEIFSVWDMATTMNRGDVLRTKYDYSEKNIYDAFIKKTKELGGDYKNMSYIKGESGRASFNKNPTSPKKDGREAVGIRGKPRREIVNISNSVKGGKRDVEFVFPIKGYGGYINYLVSANKPNPDQKFNLNKFPNDKQKKIAAQIKKTKKFDKEYDKMEAMGFKEGYDIYLPSVQAEISLKKGEIFIPERVFNPSLADNYEFVNFMELLKK